MERTETYLGGRLVKVTALVNVGPSAQEPWDTYVPGRWLWLLDGVEVTEEAASALLASGGEPLDGDRDEHQGSAQGAGQHGDGSGG